MEQELPKVIPPPLPGCHADISHSTFTNSTLTLEWYRLTVSICCWHVWTRRTQNCFQQQKAIQTFQY